jgi:hypothetical protein
MMKKIFCGIILCLVAGQLSRAQEDAFKKEWAFGVNAGVTLSNIRFTPSVPQNQLIQETGGFSVLFISEKNFGIQAELNYSLRGWEEKIDTIHLNQYSRSLTYLELPIMTHLYFNLSNRTRLLFIVGPQVSYNIGEKTLKKELHASSFADPNYYNYYDQKIQHSFDYGIVGGMGFELCTGIGSFILDGRYYFGLADIFNNTKGDRFQASANQVVGVKLTYLFNLNR